MNDIASSQLAVLDDRLAAYAAGSASLSDIIADIEELASIIGNKTLYEQLFPFLMDLEEINARYLIELKEADDTGSTQEKALSPDDVEEINALLAEIKQLFHDVLAGGGA